VKDEIAALDRLFQVHPPNVRFELHLDHLLRFLGGWYPFPFADRLHRSHSQQGTAADYFGARDFPVRCHYNNYANGPDYIHPPCELGYLCDEDLRRLCWWFCPGWQNPRSSAAARGRCFAHAKEQGSGRALWAFMGGSNRNTSNSGRVGQSVQFMQFAQHCINTGDFASR